MKPRALLTGLVFAMAAGPAALRAVTLGEEIAAFLQVTAVTGREEPAAAMVLGRLAGLAITRDALGDVLLELGSGEPRRLVACALGEPGFVVSAIRDDGYLRLVPVGDDQAGALWTQSHEGQVVTVGGLQGWRAGAVAVHSVHLQQNGTPPLRAGPASAEDLYVDVGAGTPAEVGSLGIRLLDPVALIRRPVRLAGDSLAGVAAAQKAACMAVVDAARRFRAAPGAGTTVFAWTVHDGLDGAGLLRVARTEGPFAQAILLTPGFGWQVGQDSPPSPLPLPEPGHGPIADGELPTAMEGLSRVPRLPAAPTLAGSIDWGTAKVGSLGLSARYTGTPVETISIRDAEALSDVLLTFLGDARASARSGPELPPPPRIAETHEGHLPTAELLGRLVSRYGVSGAETSVREEILRALPGWAKPSVDAKGNIVLTVGSGGQPLLFIAHQDEVGFRVEAVLPDGRLRLEERGGFLSSLWEAQAALVHGDRGPVAAVFEPREDWRTAKQAAPPSPLTVYLGVSSPAEVAALGVHVGSTVTMPKGLLRLGDHRVVGRSLDDRVGSSALLLALRQIDPAQLHRRVTFVWSVEEEVGVKGAELVARQMPDSSVPIRRSSRNASPRPVWGRGRCSARWTTAISRRAR